MIRSGMDALGQSSDPDEVYVFSSGEAELKERLLIAEERIRGLELDIAPSFRGYFRSSGRLICSFLDMYHGMEALEDRRYEWSLQDMEADISFLKTESLEAVFGTGTGSMLSAWYLELFGILASALKRDMAGMLRIMETFIQLYNGFEGSFSERGEALEETQIKTVVYSYLHDYCDDMISGCLKHDNALGAGSSMLLRGILGTKKLSSLFSDRMGKDRDLDSFLSICSEHDNDLALFLGRRLRSRLLSSEAYERLISRSREKLLSCERSKDVSGQGISGQGMSGQSLSGSKAEPVHGMRLLLSIRKDVIDRCEGRIV